MIIKIGNISGAFGLKGEVKLFHDSDEPERISELHEILLDNSSEESRHSKKNNLEDQNPVTGSGEVQKASFQPYKISSKRYQGKTPVLSLAGITDRSSAEALAGLDVYVEKDDLVPPGEDAWYVDDLVGINVIASGRTIGTVKEILDNPAHEILNITRLEGGQDILLPFVDVFVHKVDIEKGIIEVNLPDGL